MMHTVELLQEALATARRLGYEVRQDWLGGDGGGHCLVRGRKWLLLDLAQSVGEQLEIVTDALRSEPDSLGAVTSPELAERLKVRSAA